MSKELPHERTNTFNVSFDNTFPTIYLHSMRSIGFDDRGQMSITEKMVQFKGKESAVNFPITAIHSVRLISDAQALWKSWPSLIEVLLLNGVFVYFARTLFLAKYDHGIWSLNALMASVFIFIIALVLFNSIVGALLNKAGCPIIQIKYLVGNTVKKCSFSADASAKDGSLLYFDKAQTIALFQLIRTHITA